MQISVYIHISLVMCTRERDKHVPPFYYYISLTIKLFSSSSFRLDNNLDTRRRELQQRYLHFVKFMARSDWSALVLEARNRIRRRSSRLMNPILARDKQQIALPDK